MTRPSSALPPSTAGEIAISALAGQGQYGVITDLAEEHDVSRQKVYALREQARAAIEAEFARHDDARRGSLRLEVTEDDVKRTSVALRVVTPSSIRDEVALLPIIYGTGWS